MYPIIDLQQKTRDCNILVSVGEASDSSVSGKLIVIIAEGNGKGDHLIMDRELSNLSRTLQDIEFQETPKTGKIHVVKATLILQDNISKTDDEVIKLC